MALNGGTITDLAGNAGVLTLADPGGAGSLGASKAIVIDTTAPSVSSVSSTSTDRPYGLGSVVNVQVTFTEALLVTGEPQLTLETGATDRIASFNSKTADNKTLIFTYTVQAGDSSADLDYTSTAALALNGGMIKDAAGNSATLTLATPGSAGSLGASKAIVVDGVAPVVSSVLGPDSATYRLGQSLNFTVNVSKDTIITGIPTLSLIIGETERQALYVSGSASTALLFRYMVQAGDLDSDGVTLVALALGDATAKDIAGNDLEVSDLSVDPMSDVQVDAVAPVLSAISPQDGNVLGGERVTLTGSGFSAATAVTFGTKDAASFTVESSTQITAIAPSGSQGAVNVTVTTPNGTTATSAAGQFNYYTYSDAPQIGEVSVGDGQAVVSFVAPHNTGGAPVTLYRVTVSPGGIVVTGKASPLVVTGLSNGTVYSFRVAAITEAGAGAESDASAPVTPMASQTILFDNPGPQSFGSASMVRAVASSGLAVGFSSTTPEVCTVTPQGALRFETAGQCTIVADQAGDQTVTAAPAVSQSFTVTPIAPDAPQIGEVSVGDGQAVVSFAAPRNTGGAAVNLYRVTVSPGGLVVTGKASPLVVTGLSNGTAYSFRVAAITEAGAGAESDASDPVTPMGSQTILFDNPGPQSFGSAPMVQAVASSGLSVGFSSTTPEVCTVTPQGALRFETAGQCTIVADQAGDQTVTAAPAVSQSFTVTPIAPDAPQIGEVSVGDGQAVVSFAAPRNTGGAAVNLYRVTVSPGGLVVTGKASPLVVTGLSNGTAYSFSVAAITEAGAGAESDASAPVTPTDDNSVPIAEAGEAQTVVAGQMVTLEGTAQSDEKDPIVVFEWTQTSGTPVALSSSSDPQPSFIAPMLDSGDQAETLIFALTVYDSKRQSDLDTVAVTVQAPLATPATEFAAKSDAIAQTISDDAARSLASALSSDLDMMAGAKARFVAQTDQPVALDVDGSFTATPVTFSTMGSFFGQSKTRNGARKMIFGTFDLRRDAQIGATTATVYGKIAWERLVSERILLGYFIGAEVARSELGASFHGSQDRLGLSFGGYGVRQMAKNLYLDGFVSLGIGRNRLQMEDDVLALDSDYVTRSARVGLGLSGVIAKHGYEIWPELAFTLGRTWLGSPDFTGTAYEQTDTHLSLDAGRVTLASLTFRPEVRIPFGQGGEDKDANLWSLAPKVICQKTSTTTACGAGADIGLQARSADGLANAKAQIWFDRIDRRTSNGVTLSLELRF